MKTTTLILSLIVLFSYAHFTAQAQIPNPSFENWENINLGLHPEEWQTFDAFSHFALNERRITRTEESQTGDYAMRMQATDVGEGTEGHVAFLGSMPGGDGNRIQLSDKPEGVTVHYKSELSGGNESQLMFFFYDASDQIIAVEEVNLPSTNGNYDNPSFDFDNLNQQGLPDVDGYYIVINTHDSDNNIQDEDYLTLDEISYDGITHEIPNGNFEDWWEVTFDDPEGWYTSNHLSAFFHGTHSAIASSDAYTGTYALEIALFEFLEELPEDIGDEMFTFAISGEFEPFMDDQPAPGFQVSDDEDPVVSGYYKFEPGHQSDSANAALVLYENGEVVSEDILVFESASDYTPFTLESTIDETESFDEATIGFIMTSTESADGVLTVDNLQWQEGEPTSIELMSGFNKDNVQTYPSPVQSEWNIKLANQLTEEGSIYIHDVRGKLIKEATIEAGSNQTTIDLSKLDEGVYLYSIDTGDAVHRGRLVKE